MDGCRGGRECRLGNRGRLDGCHLHGGGLNWRCLDLHRLSRCWLHWCGWATGLNLRVLDRCCLDLRVLDRCRLNWC